MIERFLHTFGYAFAHLLFFRASSPEKIVQRLRIAYRLVGVRINEIEFVDGTHRTIFLCPYRNLMHRRFGRKWICHEKLDRVDDGYVTFLRNHRDIHYVRPQSCGDSRYCFSEVSKH